MQLPPSLPPAARRALRRRSAQAVPRDRGRSILELSVAALAASDRIQEIVVALPEEHVDSGSKALRAAIGRPITVVAGGARRQDSVANAFAKTSKDSDIILIHDAARPFVTRE